MAKLSVKASYDAGRELASDAGRQLAGFVGFGVLAFRQIVGALKRGLTFQENFNADVKVFMLRSDTEQVVSVSKTPTGMIPIRLLSQTSQVDTFNWWIDDQSRVTVKAKFTDSPADALELTVVVLYG